MSRHQISLSTLDSGHRRRRYSFALTPLADAMFQLLIFFMLSSTLSPYSLIALTAGAPAGQTAIAAVPDLAATTPDPDTPLLIWHLSRGQIRAGNETLALSDLASLAPTLLSDTAAEILIFPTRSATVQDIATVLEILGIHGIQKVRLVSGSQVQGG